MDEYCEIFDKISQEIKLERDLVLHPITSIGSDSSVLCVIIGDISIRDSVSFMDCDECFCTGNGLLEILHKGITKDKLKRYANQLGQDSIYFVKLKNTPEKFVNSDVLAIAIPFTMGSTYGYVYPYDIDGDIFPVIRQTNMNNVESGYKREIVLDTAVVYLNQLFEP